MKKFFLFASVATVLVACGGRQVRYGDAGKVETVNEKFGSTDLQSITKAMVDDMIKVAGDEGIFDIDTRKPALALRTFRNDSGENVNMRDIQDKVRTALLRSRKFKFTTENPKDVLEELEMQEDSGLYKNGAKKGNWTPPQYLVRGRLSAIKKENEDVKDVYFLFTMYLDNVETAESVWSIEKEIRKEVTK